MKIQKFVTSSHSTLESGRDEKGCKMGGDETRSGYVQNVPVILPNVPARTTFIELYSLFWHICANPSFEHTNVPWSTQHTWTPFHHPRKMDVDGRRHLDKRRLLTDWKRAVWSTSTKKKAVWSTSTNHFFYLVDIDGRRQRLPFSRSTAGSSFHHALEWWATQVENWIFWSALKIIICYQQLLNL